MMEREEWQSKIMATVEHIASREYQSWAWFGLSDSVSSPDELFNELFDDLTFHSFFKKYSGEFTEDQKLAWKDLEGRLQSYAETTSETMNPQTVFADPRWEAIRNSAHSFLEAFRGHSGPVAEKV
jgi:hypothetical protein